MASNEPFSSGSLAAKEMNAQAREMAALSHDRVELYERTRRRHVAHMQAELPRHLERLHWPAERLQQERNQRLRALVRLARECSPWHAARLADVELADLSEQTIGCLPVMTKDDLMANFDAVLTDRRITLELVERHLAALSTDRYLLGELHAVASGGSSGRRGVFVYDWDGWAACYLTLVRYELRSLLQRKTNAPVVFCAVMADIALHMSQAILQTFSGAAATVYRFPVTLPLREIVAGLNRAQPTVLIGYPSALHALMFEVRAGRLRIAPALVLSGSEPLLPEIRRALEETWHVPVHNGYGVSEAGGVATSCDEGDRLHLTDDLLIVEPVDERGRPVPPGTRAAKLYLTNLYNTLQPLIRYEITDEITVLAGTCSCGSGHRTIGDVQGRLSDSFCYPDGVRVHPLRFATPLESERNVVEYQVRQTMRGAAIALVCAGSLDAARLGERIERSLAEAGLAQPEVVVEQVDRLPRQESGKLKRFIAL